MTHDLFEQRPLCCIIFVCIRYISKIESIDLRSFHRRKNRFIHFSNLFTVSRFELGCIETTLKRLCYPSSYTNLHVTEYYHSTVIVLHTSVQLKISNNIESRFRCTRFPVIRSENNKKHFITFSFRRNRNCNNQLGLIPCICNFRSSARPARRSEFGS